MTYPIRPITPDEFEAFANAAATAFGWQETPEDIDRARSLVEFDRSLAAFDGTRVIGTAAAVSFRLTVPGNRQIPAAGITSVSVFPTHRRQGVLTGIMRQQMLDIRERGEPVAILYASESLIYRRFGYGQATNETRFTIARRHAQLAGQDLSGAGVELVDAQPAREIVPPIFERARRSIPGQVNRSAAWWDNRMQDPASDREPGYSRRFYAVHRNAQGNQDGYAIYQVKGDWSDGLPAGTIALRELFAESMESYVALWRYCLSLDLSETVEAYTRPLDEPLRWMLTDPRRLQVTRLSDALWVRVIDVAAGLAARRYGASGSLVIEVHDEFLEGQPCRYQLDGGPDGSVCRATTRSADLSMRAADLGALYLGNVSPAVLAQAGRITEHRAGSLVTAGTMFMSPLAPWCSTHF